MDILLHPVCIISCVKRVINWEKYGKSKIACFMGLWDFTNILESKWGKKIGTISKHKFNHTAKSWFITKISLLAQVSLTGSHCQGNGSLNRTEGLQHVSKSHLQDIIMINLQCNWIRGWALQWLSCTYHVTMQWYITTKFKYFVTLKT